MSYQDFLNSLILPFQYFVNWLSSFADSLIHNYIIITLIGISLFFSLFWVVFNLISNIKYNHTNKFNDYNDNILKSKNINFHD